MIDTHCHLLPRLDDGPSSTSSALALARRFAADGVETAVCTPHFSHRFPTPHGAARERFERLREELALLEIELALELGAEVSANRALAARTDELRARAIAGTFVLVELVSQTPPDAVPAIHERVVDAGLTPVFAHPERCAAVRRSPELLAEARAGGAWIQVVAPSLVGRWGDEVWRAAWRFVEEGVADLVASDAHGVSPTEPTLAAVAALVETRCGVDVAARLARENPARMLRAATAAGPFGSDA